MSEQAILEIGTITLKWSSWVAGPNVLIANRGGVGVHIPNGKPGVYEVKRVGHGGDEWLYIGETSNLRFRIRQGLVTGRAGHSNAPARVRRRGVAPPVSSLGWEPSALQPHRPQEELKQPSTAAALDIYLSSARVER